MVKSQSVECKLLVKDVHGAISEHKLVWSPCRHARGDIVEKRLFTDRATVKHQNPPSNYSINTRSDWLQWWSHDIRDQSWSPWFGPWASLLGPVLFWVYKLPLRYISCHPGISFHCYTNDTSLYLCQNLFRPGHSAELPTGCERVDVTELSAAEIWRNQFYHWSSVSKLNHACRITTGLTKTTVFDTMCVRMRRYRVVFHTSKSC